MPSPTISNEAESYLQFSARVTTWIRFRCPWCRFGVKLTKTLCQMKAWREGKGNARCPRCGQPVYYFMGKVTKGGPDAETD